MLAEVVSEENFLAAVDEANVGEAKRKQDVLILLDQFLNGHENSLEGVLNNIFAHLAASSNRNGVSINHAETLLEDASLGLSWAYFFLVLVADQMGL